MSVGCSVTGWSAVASASANASLAAVLAGFMINGIVLVLAYKPSEMKAEYIQALALLFAAFVGLVMLTVGATFKSSLRIVPRP